ncbi:MAG: hypothetical protein H6897_16470 [Rhodobacteraceae bacterium]|uniref:hypothetical protein n=1 Tax=Albidovulum sp. TaxID=1872424 RepID=UPI001DF44D2F|nr:hypothetical protein [uncultured Defluviimonas sp.]MCB2125872.1 hypothetical protein [Paracoccaceae bacterium]MCC0071510.1 hypothetical protein [Paracoccaceae bacterium]
MTGSGANSLRLEGARIATGCWQAELVAPGADEAPAVEVWHQEARLDGVTLGAPLAPGRWPVSVPIPTALLSDGVQTFLVRDPATGATLGHFTIVTGVPLEDDIRAEIDLLRAELDMLKKAFRRHCVETGGT